MSYSSVNSEFSNTEWLIFDQNTIQTIEGSVEYEQLGSFTQGTNWEKVFNLGDIINSGALMTEQDIVNETKAYRNSKK